MQILDPRIGNQRQKGLMKRVAAKAMKRKGYTSKVGTFGKLANAGKMTRGLRPNKGPGQQLKGAKPGGYGSILDGLHGNGGWQGQGAQYVNTAPVQAELPDWYQGGGDPEGMSDVVIPGEAQYVNVPGNGQNQGSQAANPDQLAVAGNTDAEWLASVDDPNHGAGGFAAPALQQTGPSAPITAPGGLIPLGGGRYYDPVNDRIMGQGTGQGRVQ